MTTWFSSDLHFRHKNIITEAYDNRPFDTIEEHDETIISNWNSLVGKNDTTYLLGDVCFGGVTKVEEKINALNGKKHLILGNHDKRKWNRNGIFESVHSTGSYRESDISVFLFHNPVEAWSWMETGVLHFHGHLHHKGHHAGVMPKKNRIDVGINGYDMKPLSFEQAVDEVRKHNEKYGF